MKKNISTKVFSTIVILFLCIINSCKFEPAELKLTVTYDYEDNIVSGNATITDNGGCTNFTEQGAMFSLYKEPTLVDKYAEIECFNTNVENTSFEVLFKLPHYDTTFYVRAYVKTNAGIGYSNIVEIRTSPSISK